MPLFTFLFWFFQDSAGLGFNHKKMCVCMYVYAAYRYSESMSREAIQKGEKNLFQVEFLIVESPQMLMLSVRQILLWSL